MMTVTGINMIGTAFQMSYNGSMIGYAPVQYGAPVQLEQQ